MYFQKLNMSLLTSLCTKIRNLTSVHFALSEKFFFVYILVEIKNIFLNVHINTIDFPIEHNVGSVQSCMVFWSSDCQESIRETVWRKKLSLWRLVLADSAL
ncbi:hypothetical protein ILYODFUR_027188 [Ilyodon furcidens]|uniref:Uncharacterized protein n=1 Tax=Ilyodon furcidens TaxID=33524 RepID=A0ABV0TM27_9TELE